MTDNEYLLAEYHGAMADGFLIIIAIIVSCILIHKTIGLMIKSKLIKDECKKLQSIIDSTKGD